MKSNKQKIVNWSRAYLDQLVKDGKIKSHSLQDPPDQKQTARKKLKQKKRAKQVIWLHWNLWYWCEQRGFTLEVEKHFHSTRLWRFDFAIKELKVAIEYEGIGSQKSRHTTHSGYTGDTEKYNAAIAEGWQPLRYTYRNYKNFLADITKIFENQKQNHENNPPGSADR